MEEFIRSLPWEQVYLFLQEQKGIHTEDEKRVRRFFEGVCIVLRSGMQWRFLPAEYGSWRAVHQRFYVGNVKVFGMDYCTML